MNQIQKSYVWWLLYLFYGPGLWWRSFYAVAQGLVDRVSRRVHSKISKIKDCIRWGIVLWSQRFSITISVKNVSRQVRCASLDTVNLISFLNQWRCVDMRKKQRENNSKISLCLIYGFVLLWESQRHSVLIRAVTDWKVMNYEKKSKDPEIRSPLNWSW